MIYNANDILFRENHMTQEAIKIYNQGYYLYSGTSGFQKDHKKAIVYFQKAAQLGVPEAMNYLSVMYETGDCVEKNEKKAVEWLIKALSIKKDNRFAAYNLGRMFYYGVGVAKNHKFAFEYYIKAANLGSSDAMNDIGLMYESGEYLEKDYVKATQWYMNSISASNSNKYAAFNMARMYYNGFGVAKNMDRAYVYADAAVTLSRENMDMHYAKCYFLKGCILMEHYKDYHKASECFLVAAFNNNMPEAWHNLGYFACQGLLLPSLYSGTRRVDMDITAKFYYQKAANLGYAPSMDELGRLHVYYQDMKTAYFWLNKAAEKGYEPSIKRLRMLKTAKILQNISDALPGDTSSFSSTLQINIDNFFNSNETRNNASGPIFKDSKGNLCAPGSPFYDAKGNLCEWGSAFYDFKGNYCTSGSAFYDSRGNYCSWGSPFYDAEGNYIVP